MSDEVVVEFEITGAGVSDANGKYSLTNPCGTEGRPEYTNTRNPEYKVQWSSMSSVWMLDYVHGAAPYMISGRHNMKFPWDAEWSVYQGGRLPVPTTVYSKPESEGCTPVSLETFVDTLHLSKDESISTVEILQRESVTVKQLLSCILDEELEEIGICSEARTAIAAARPSPQA
mmetsp:Transcript_6545/g.14313  ORF Transcript_6545/g.14313 Transcript_6545/m.14313 type:complete len:174 (-) Transcript_6545:25-546(-)